MNYKTILVATLILPTGLWAQDQVKKIQPNSITVMPFGSIGSGATSTIDDFKKLSPNSTLLPDDLSDFNTSSYNANSGALGTAVLLSFKFRDESGTAYRPNPELRLGISYNYSRSMYNNAYKEDRFAHDTLISVKTGERTAVDSVSYTGYDMNYSTQFVRLDASLIYRTNPKARWNFFAGVGATVGVSVSSQTNINYYQHYYIQPNDNESSIYINRSGYDGEFESETTRNESSMAYSAYIPLGLDFRIADKSEFWQRVHLFYEMRPTIDFLSIPELNTYTTVAWQHGFGVKVQWN